jgi:hypothetical protein
MCWLQLPWSPTFQPGAVNAVAGPCHDGTLPLIVWPAISCGLSLHATSARADNINAANVFIGFIGL